MKEYTERLYESFSQSFRIDKIHFEKRTEHQHLIIFENALFGRVMALDGIIQTTQVDEFIYHEMLAHVPIFAHGAVKKVLIIGGGDGGMLREVCRHKSISEITQVEIDAEVIEVSRSWLPSLSQGAFDDPRVNIVIDDGYHFIQTTDQRFDVIISDSTDPIGPARVLFGEDFYVACKRCLTPKGVLVMQNGVAFLQLDEVETTAKRLYPHFSDVHFFSAAVPTYAGGVMTFGWATDNTSLRTLPTATIEQRFNQANIKTRYYNPAIHTASFALPQYILDRIMA